MATKSQHTASDERLQSFLSALREEAGLTRREPGRRSSKPQRWVHDCETGNRRVDVTEFVGGADACGIDAQDAFRRFLEADVRYEVREESPGVGREAT